MGRLPTVTIWDEGRGAVDINESDYDPEIHTLYTGASEAPTEEPVEADIGADPVYWIEENPPWFSLHGPDGKIGKSTRDEGEANARLRALLEDDE